LKTTGTRILKLVIGLVLLVVFALGICYFVFLKAVRVPTASMANTIIPGDHLLVKRRAFGEISRGDLIIFDYPKDRSVKYVSRVVGLPGEAIELRGTSIYINGKELPEQRVIVNQDFESEALEELSTEGSGPYRVFYSQRPTGTSEVEGIFGTDGPFRIPANEYFVMGDNRDNSEDSRYWGTVPRALIFGKPTVIYWSVNRTKGGDENPRWERVFTKLK
jgi:signal peptidase I